ncbi:hypothetical protein Hanom_Chr00s000001g01593171 [Helianthus anomalus]
MNKMWDTCQVVVQSQWIFGGKTWESLFVYTGSEFGTTIPGFLTRVYKSWNNLIPSFFSFKRLLGYFFLQNPSIGNYLSSSSYGCKWFVLFTSDYFALDVLLNCLTVLSSKYLGIQHVGF